MSENEKNALKTRRIAGGSIVDYAPVFSANGEILFVIWRNSVRMYSATTGEWLRDLEGPENEIIAIQLDLYNPKILVCCSVTGEIVLWKWKSGVVAFKGKLSFPVTSVEVTNFHLLDLYGDKSYVVASWRQAKGQVFQIDYFNLETMVRLNRGRGLNFITLGAEDVRLAVGIKYFAVIQGTSLYAIFTDIDMGRWVYNSRNQGNIFTFVLCHPEEMLILTGNDLGEVKAWRGFEPKGFVINTNYHWHPTAVNTIAFTESGTYFYSGGREAVVVKWMLDHTHRRDFKTRLQGDIRHIVVSSDNTAVAVSTDDNGIRIYNSQMQQVTYIQHFTWMKMDNTKRESFPVGLKLNPRTSSIVLNGVEGHLQFFSTQTRSLLYSVDITSENRMCEERFKVLFNTRVMKTALTMDWMATAEVWDDRKLTPKTRIKFFKFDQEQQNYSLNTNIEMPHAETVTAIEFSCAYSDPNILCASSGGDNYIKVWGLGSSGNIYRKDLSWYCMTRFNYKNLPIDSLTFSQDGSLLAAGCGNILCIWNPETSKLKCALSAPAALDGSSHKVLLNIAENIRPRNGARKSISKPDEKRQKKIIDRRKHILEQIKLLLDAKDGSFVHNVKTSPDNVKAPSCKVSIDSLTISEQELLFKKIMALNELNIFQKFELFSFLKICCRTEEETRVKLLDMLNTKRQERKQLEDRIKHLVQHLSDKYKFVCKQKLYDYVIKRRKWMERTKAKHLPFSRILSSSVYSKQLNAGKSTTTVPKHQQNGTAVADSMEVDVEAAATLGVESEDVPQKMLPQINHVIFGTGNHGHLVVVCTDNRLLVWNLLTLRLQTAVKLSVDRISMDPYTNLIAAFTKYNELYVFQPNVPFPLYHQKNIPRIFGAVWVPRRVSRQLSLSLDWQSVSQLFFLNEKQELLYLASDNDIDSIASSVALPNDNPQPLPMTPFASILMRQSGTNAQYNHTMDDGFSQIGTVQSTVVKEIMTYSPHTMCPVMNLCQNFLKSMLIVDTGIRDNNKSAPKEKIMNGDVKDVESDVDDNDDDDDDAIDKERLATRKKRIELAEHHMKSGKSVSEVVAVHKKLKQISRQSINLDIKI